MTAVTRQWHLRPHGGELLTLLSRGLRCSPIVAQLLVNRGITSVEDGLIFLKMPMSKLHNPATMPGIAAAVAVIVAAVRDGTPITVYGDYDVDGTTGTAILLGLLKRLGAVVDFYLPHRIEEGYGLRSKAIRELHERGTRLLVTVDCGIAAVKEVAEARAMGMKVVVTDHHEPKATLPDADAIVHPRLAGSEYPFGQICGAAVAFKLAWLIATEYCGSSKVPTAMQDYLLDCTTMATLGSVADVMPLIDENRIFVNYGLKRLSEKPFPGLKALIEVSGLSGDGIRSDSIGFKLGPKINAAGRMGHANVVVELLTTLDPVRAAALSEFLKAQNEDRQSLTSSMVDLAKRKLAETDWNADPLVILWHTRSLEDWHPGVIGNVASRVVEYTGRPAMLLGLDPETGLMGGSGRSIDGFSLLAVLDDCAEFLSHHGGHAMAAGLSVKKDRLEAFREAAFASARRQLGGDVPPPPVLNLEAEVPLSSVTRGFFRDIQAMEPCGNANPKPIFLAGPVDIENVRRMGKDQKHLSFRLRSGPTSMRGVAWSMGDRFDELVSARRVSVAFAVTENHYNGNSTVEIEAKDFQVGEAAQLV